MKKQNLEKVFEADKGRFVEDWKAVLRFASISGEPEHANDCRMCAEWLVAHLKSMGFQSRLIETGGHPLVFGERRGKPGKPVVLFYGHYDVQPVDPVDKWKTPPFEPDLRGSRLYARGAQDNKGQLMYALKAIETLVRNNALECGMKILIEGEEEGGGPATFKTLPSLRAELAADILMACDVQAAPSGLPTITMGLRGLAQLTAVLHGPAHDLHSGSHGGRAPNPATGMARLVATLHNTDGSVAVEGFYEGVREPTQKERMLAAKGAVDDETYRRQTGVMPVAGEVRFLPVERVGFRPSLEVNGIHSGYGGPGAKTIIPSDAIVKLTMRLIAGQDPAKILAAVIAHLERNTPPGLRIEVTEKGIFGGALRLDVDSPVVVKAGRVLRDLFGQEVAMLWEGASVPIVEELIKISGAEPLLVGFGLEEDNIHAVNESFSLEQFRGGFMYVATFLASL